MAGQGLPCLNLGLEIPLEEASFIYAVLFLLNGRYIPANRTFCYATTFNSTLSLNIVGAPSVPAPLARRPHDPLLSRLRRYALSASKTSANGAAHIGLDRDGAAGGDGRGDGG